MYQRLQEKIEGVRLNGHPTQRLPNNLNVSLLGIDAKLLMMNLKSVAISTGSACTSASVEPSHVVLALGFGEERAHSAIRIGVGRFSDSKQIGQAVDRIARIVQSYKGEESPGI